MTMISQMESNYEKLKNKRFLTSDELKERDLLFKSIEDYRSHKRGLEEEFFRQQEEKAKKVIVGMVFSVKERMNGFLNFMKAQNKSKKRKKEELESFISMEKSQETSTLGRQETETMNQEDWLKKLKKQLQKIKQNLKEIQETREQLLYKEECLSNTVMIRKWQVQELVAERSSYSYIVTDLCGMKILARLQLLTMKDQVDTAMKGFQCLVEETNKDLLTMEAEKNDENLENENTVNEIWKMSELQKTEELKERKRECLGLSWNLVPFISFLECASQCFQFASTIKMDEKSKCKELQKEADSLFEIVSEFQMEWGECKMTLKSSGRSRGSSVSPSKLDSFLRPQRNIQEDRKFMELIHRLWTQKDMFQKTTQELCYQLKMLNLKHFSLQRKGLDLLEEKASNELKLRSGILCLQKLKETDLFEPLSATQEVSEESSLSALESHWSQLESIRRGQVSLKSQCKDTTSFLMKVYNSQVGMVDRFIRVILSIDEITESSIIPTHLSLFVKEQWTLIHSVLKGFHVEKLPKTPFDSFVPSFLKKLWISGLSFQVSSHGLSHQSPSQGSITEIGSLIEGSEMETLSFFLREADFVSVFLDSFLIKKKIRRLGSPTFDEAFRFLNDSGFLAYTKNFLACLLAFQESMSMVQKQVFRLKQRFNKGTSPSGSETRKKVSVKRNLLMHLHKRNPMSKIHVSFERVTTRKEKDNLLELKRGKIYKYGGFEEKELEFDEIKKKIKEISVTKKEPKPREKEVCSCGIRRLEEAFAVEEQERGKTGKKTEEEGEILNRGISEKMGIREAKIQEYGGLSKDEERESQNPTIKRKEKILKRNQVIEFNEYLSKISKSNPHSTSCSLVIKMMAIVSREKEAMDRERVKGNSSGSGLFGAVKLESKSQEGRKTNRKSLAMTSSTKDPKQRRNKSFGTAIATTRKTDTLGAIGIERKREKKAKRDPEAMARFPKRAISSKTRRFRISRQNDQSTLLNSSWLEEFSASNKPFEDFPYAKFVKTATNFPKKEKSPEFLQKVMFSPQDRLYSAPKAPERLSRFEEISEDLSIEKEMRLYKPRNSLFPSTIFFIPKHIPFSSDPKSP